VVGPDDEVLVVMEKGKVVRSRVGEVRMTGRDTSGVRFATPDPGDSIIAVTRGVERAVEVAVGDDGATGSPRSADAPAQPTEQAPAGSPDDAPAVRPDSTEGNGVPSPESDPGGEA